jgi:hypothetical protein
MNCGLMLTYDTPALWQTGSRNLTDQKYPISWEVFLDPSDSYFLFADFVDFYTHWTYMLIFCRIFLSNYYQKTLPTIWGTYMKLVTKYQISAINSCWEKCDKKWAYMFPSKIFFVAFFSVTVDGRNLIFGHKHHIGLPYCGINQFPCK